MLTTVTPAGSRITTGQVVEPPRRRMRDQFDRVWSALPAVPAGFVRRFVSVWRQADRATFDVALVDEPATFAVAPA